MDLVSEQPQELLHGAQRFFRRAFQRRLVRDELAAVGRPRVGAPIAIAEPERQAHLPAEVRPQEIRQIGAIGRRHQRRPALRIVLAEAEVVEQQISIAIPQRLRQRAEIPGFQLTGASNRDSIHAA